MLHKELNEVQKRQYDRTLVKDHFIRVAIRIHDQNEKVIGSYTSPENRLISGSVQVQANQTITRTLDVQLLDPHFKLHFDRWSPSPFAIYMDKFVSVLYGVWCPTINSGEWVDCFVFYGPVTGFNRQGVEVQLTASSKEIMLMAPRFVHNGYSIKPGTKITDAVERVARGAGERKIALPDLNKRLSQGRQVHRKAEPWKVITTRGHHVPRFIIPGHEHKAKPHHKPDPDEPAQGLMSKLPSAWEAYYTPDGFLTMRKKHKHSRFVFVEGEHLTSRADVAYNMNFINTVDVTGSPVKNKDPVPHAEVSLRSDHQRSPESLSWNGVPQYFTEFIHADELHSNAECKGRADEELRRRAVEGIDVQFECLPIPYLLENDRVTLQPHHGSPLEFEMRDFTIPLTSDTPMSVGKHLRHKLRHRSKDHGGAAGGRGGTGGTGGKPPKPKPPKHHHHGGGDHPHRTGHWRRHHPGGHPGTHDHHGHRHHHKHHRRGGGGN